MTLEEVRAYFGSSYKFSMITGLAHTNFNNWKRKGYIPFLTQGRIEELTKGDLKAIYTDGEGSDHAKSQ